MDLNLILEEFLKSANTERQKSFARFFKTAPGGYGEGDEFLGIMVPVIRIFVRTYAHKLHSAEIPFFVTSKYHEVRLFGLLCWVAQHKKAPQEQKGEIYTLYTHHFSHINNWDLVDLSAPHIVGPHASIEQLEEWAKSTDIWTRRIAMLATFYDISHNKPDKAMLIATVLRHDAHDLIHKAVGWMLREVGKRCSETLLEDFLTAYAKELPRTMLRYAIERLSPEKRAPYMVR